MNDITCKCGHRKEQHEFDHVTTQLVCTVPGSGWNNWADRCMDYNPDNLMHIETLAKEKGLV
jgi:hypothetical protein